MTDDYAEAIRHLNFAAQAPTAEDIRWIDYSAHHIEEFNNEVDRVISKYSHALDPEIIELLHDLSESTAGSMIIDMVDKKGAIRELADDEDQIFILMGMAVADNIEDHLTHLLHLLEYYEEDGAPDVTAFDSD